MQQISRLFVKNTPFFFFA